MQFPRSATIQQAHFDMIFFLDQLVVQFQNLTVKSGNTLYKAATKFDFHNDNILSEKNVNAFNFESSLTNLTRGKASRELQRYMLQHFLSRPRADESAASHQQTASYLATKLGRLGLYVLSHNFRLVCDWSHDPNTDL